MDIDEHHLLENIVPQIDRTFRAEKYIGVFDIISLRIAYEFDHEMDHFITRQSFTARKACTGPNGWCAPISTQSQLYYLYKHQNGEIITSRLIEDDKHHYYMVADFRQNFKIDEVIHFSTETKQRLESFILQAENKRLKIFFLSRLYGSSCEDCEMTIHIPYRYKLKRSIPQLRGKSGVYIHRPKVKKLEPIQIALVVRKKFLPFIGRIFHRNTHPFVWAVISALLGILFLAILALAKKHMKGDT